MDLIFFGMQGAGKGTLGKEVAKKFNYKIFETGAELRKLAQEDSPLGQKIKSVIESGALVSNEIVMEIVQNFMNQISKDEKILFDGIPRSEVQAKTLNELLEKNNRNYKAVLIDIKKETALERLTTRRLCSVCKHVYAKDYLDKTCKQLVDGKTCGGELITRKDDTPDAIKIRLKAFEDETVGAIKMYEDNMLKIDGEPNISEVYKDAEAKIELILK